MKRSSSVYCFLFITAFIIAGCSSSPRFTSRNNNSLVRNPAEINAIRVLMGNPSSYFTWTIESAVNVSIDNKDAAIINPGNQVELSPDGDNVNMKISGRSFSGKVITFSPRENLIKFQGHSYRGTIKVFANNNLISVVNSLSLEDYLKGVLPLEMPTGNNNENYEALKAFAICARTYSLNKLSENKTTFDVYIDTRDQVYGGVESEKDITNKAVDDTRDLILTYNGQPTITYYSAACGGHTENVKDVFSTNGKDLPYLAGVKDGDEPYCSIAPKFNWVEEYTEQTFLSRLKAAGQIDSDNYKIDNIEAASRFESGRVNELRITLESDNGDDKVVSLYGNNIRSVIRTADNKGILRSNLFDISLNDGNVTITGKGNGHGVGLCQWGSIYLSRIGWNYKDILSHYFSGTQIANIKR
jgi:stage II sporulation protein D (peptidoglycan lytic transglycosylase)